MCKRKSKKALWGALFYVKLLNSLKQLSEDPFFFGAKEGLDGGVEFGVETGSIVFGRL